MYILLILCCVLSIGITAKLPNYIKPCSISDPNIKQCMVNSAQNAVEIIRKGDKAYKVPSYDPEIHIPLIEISMGDDLQIIFKDVVIVAFRDIKFKDIDWDPKTGILTMRFDIPSMTADVNYTLNMKLMGLPISGQGKGNLTLTNWNMEYTPKLKTTNKKGVEYLEIESSTLTFEINDLVVYFADLFNGDPRLGDATNKLLNDNWRELFDVLRPTVVVILKGLFDNSLKGYLGSVPKNEIFLS